MSLFHRGWVLSQIFSRHNSFVRPVCWFLEKFFYQFPLPEKNNLYHSSDCVWLRVRLRVQLLNCKENFAFTGVTAYLESERAVQLGAERKCVYLYYTKKNTHHTGVEQKANSVFSLHESSSRYVLRQSLMLRLGITTAYTQYCDWVSSSISVWFFINAIQQGVKPTFAILDAITKSTARINRFRLLL